MKRIINWLDFIFTFPLLAYRRLRYGYTFRRIYLGGGKFTIVDPPDYYRLNNFHWSARKNSNCTYAVRFLNDPGKKPKIISLHREIMNPAPRLLVDHKNRNTLDNRRANLRIATHSQNQFNKAKTSEKTSSRFIGVYLEKPSCLWATKISHHGKSIWLGRFNSELTAARAYDNAARKYHKEFARLNFPEETPDS
jgi:hypothetical protein